MSMSPPKTVNLCSLADLDEWCKNLYSGKFEQGDGCLYDPTTSRYCCLGVLEQQMNPAAFDEIFSDNLSQYITTESTIDYRLLPEKTQEALSELNDYWEFTFPQIADTIRFFAEEVLSGEINNILIKMSKNNPLSPLD